MTGRSPKRLIAVIVLAVGIGALVPATAASAKTSVKPTNSSTTTVVAPQDWWF